MKNNVIALEHAFDAAQARFEADIQALARAVLRGAGVETAKYSLRVSRRRMLIAGEAVALAIAAAQDSADALMTNIAAALA